MSTRLWEAVRGSTPGTSVVHPVDDLVEHDVDGEDACVCGPRVEPVPRGDGSFGWMFVHHALDGRI